MFRQREHSKETPKEH